MFIDRKGKLEIDLDIVRETGGADYLESVAGFTGQGVRAEVADTELDETHPEWSAPPIIHVAGGGTLHGTSVYGILFAQGVNPQARGIIPDGVGIFANSTGLLGGGPTRYTHTAELVDPGRPLPGRAPDQQHGRSAHLLLHHDLGRDGRHPVHQRHPDHPVAEQRRQPGLAPAGLGQEHRFRGRRGSLQHR